MNILRKIHSKYIILSTKRKEEKRLEIELVTYLTRISITGMLHYVTLILYTLHISPINPIMIIIIYNSYLNCNLKFGNVSVISSLLDFIFSIILQYYDQAHISLSATFSVPTFSNICTRSLQMIYFLTYMTLLWNHFMHAIESQLTSIKCCAPQI